MAAGKKNNAVCCICGNGYYMCQSCKDQLRLSPWKIHTDTSEHFKIFQIVRGFSIGLYTKDEAKNKFDNVDLSDLETFIPNVKSAINSILTEKTSNKNEADGFVKLKAKKRGRTNTVKTENLEQAEENV